MLKLVASSKHKVGMQRKIVILGLSKINIQRLQEGKPITFDGEDVELSNVDFVIFTGDTEQSMTRDLYSLIGPNTEVKMDPRATDA